MAVAGGVAVRDLRSRTLRGWLARRGLVAGSERWDDFFEPKLSKLSDPSAMADRDCISERLALAVRRRERVVVFGDYDCDGLTSAVLLCEVIERLGGVATPLFASRFDGGYGVSEAALKRIERAGCDVLVTCDCGSSDHRTLSEISRSGVDVAVIDHHLVPSERLPVLGFLNPHRADCAFGYKGLASVGLAFSVAAALRRKCGIDLDMRQWLDLVAVGTIGDVAPLDGDNRALVRAGLRTLQEGRRPGLAALLDASRVSRRLPLTGRDVAFRLAPLINAPGRMGPPDVAAQLLLATSLDAARPLAAEVVALSAARREEQERMVATAETEIETCGYAARAAIVVGQSGWNHGIVGIVAGRLADRYGVPCVVVGFDGEHGRGSVRGPKGARLHDLVQACEAILVRFGGHQQAAGLEVARSRLGELRECFTRAADASKGATSVPVEAPVELDPADEPAWVLEDLDALEPCGERNPRPILRVTASVLDARVVGQQHVKLTLKPERGGALSCFAPNQGDQLGRLRGVVSVLGDLRHSDFAGGPPFELLVERIEG